MKRFGWVLLLLAGWAGAAELPNQGVIVNDNLGYGATYYLDVSQAKSVSMQVTWSSSTIAAKTFTDGSASSGSFTVASVTALSSATASLSIRISSNTALQNQVLYVAGTNIPIRVDTTASSMTACNIASDIASQTVLLSTCAIGSASGIVYSTAPAFGTFWNRFAIQSSSLTAISSGTFTGGQDNATLTVGTVTLAANRDWYPTGTTNQTANSIASAINAKSLVVVSSVPASAAVVYATSTANGTGVGFALVSSTNAALAVSPTVTVSGSVGTGAMTGGTAPAWTIQTAVINIPSHGFSTGVPVLFTTSSAVGLNGLTFGTTYYAVKIDANNIALASSANNAVIGTTITLTSSNTLPTAHTYNLSVPNTTGTPILTWKVANDKANLMPWTVNTSSIPISTVTMGSFVAGGTTYVWDPGQIDFNWLAAVLTVPPTQGAINVKAIVGGK